MSLLHMRAQDLQAGRLGAAMGLIKGPMVVEAPVNRVEVVYAPATCRVLQRESTARLDSLREADGSTIDKPTGCREVHVACALGQSRQQAPTPGCGGMVPLSV